MSAESHPQSFKVGRRGFIFLGGTSLGLAYAGAKKWQNNQLLEDRVKDASLDDPRIKNLLEEQRFHKDMVDVYQSRVLSSRTKEEQNFFIVSRNQEEKDRKRFEDLANKRFRELENKFGLRFTDKFIPFGFFAGALGLLPCASIIARMLSIPSKGLSYNTGRVHSFLVKH